MNVNPIVFSNNKKYRLIRHTLFWSTWILYYALVSAIILSKSYGFTKSFFESLTEVAESTPIDMCFCYFIIYYLLPKYLFRGKYLRMLFFWLVASILFIFLYQLNMKFIFPYIQAFYGMGMHEANSTGGFWSFFTLYGAFNLFSQINMEGCVAASIKLGKLWYVKQQEVDILREEKEKIEAHEQQGLIQPAFLADLLARIESITAENPAIASQSINKIRSLVLYLLYETASRQVPLQRELSLLKEYIDLETLTSKRNIRVTSSIGEVNESETIVPLIILPLVENAFKQVSMYSIDDLWIRVKIKLHMSILHMQLSWSKPIDTSSLINGRNVILHNISKRLKLIYPQSHDLKMSIESEQIIVSMQIDLRNAVK